MFKKPQIINTTRQVAAAFKPAYIRRLEPDNEEGEKEKRVVYVTPDGREVDAPAEDRCWARVYGGPMPGQRHSGFNNRTKDRFIVCRRKGAGPISVVVAVHVFPHHEFDLRMKPAKISEIEEISIKVDQVTGECTILEMPLRMQVAHVQNLLSAIDKLDELKPGQVLVESIGAIVQSIIGGDLKVSFRLADESTQTTLGAAMGTM